MVLDAPREAERPAGRSHCGNIRSRREVGQQAAIDEAREGRVGARPLLENSTACRKSVPSNTPFVGFFGLIDIAICQVAVLGLVSNSSTESLILAQDERWRRA